MKKTRGATKLRRVQFRDYDVWLDCLDEDGNSATFRGYQKAAEYMWEQKDIYPMTNFRIVLD